MNAANLDQPGSGLMLAWWVREWSAPVGTPGRRPTSYDTFGGEIRIVRYGRKWRLMEPTPEELPNVRGRFPRPDWKGQPVVLRGGLTMEFDAAMEAALWEQDRFLRRNPLPDTLRLEARALALSLSVPPPGWKPTPTGRIQEPPRPQALPLNRPTEQEGFFNDPPTTHRPRKKLL